MPENNQDLTKVYELIQKNNEQIHQESRWNRITNLAQTALTLVPTVFLIWKSLKGKGLTPKRRLMRNEAAQARQKLNHEAAQAKLQLEREIILKEVQYEEDLNKMETGLDITKENKSDFLNTFKQKGEEILKDKVNQVQEKLDTFDKKTKKS